MLSDAHEPLRAHLVEQLLKALAHSEDKLDGHPRLQEIQQHLNQAMASNQVDVAVLSAEQIATLSSQFGPPPRPTLNRDRQAFVRILSTTVPTQSELEKIQTRGDKFVSAMTLVGQKAPFEVYDRSY